MRYAFSKPSIECSYQFSGFPIKASSVVDCRHHRPDMGYCIWGAQGTTRVERQSVLIFNETQLDDGETFIDNVNDMCQQALADYMGQWELLQLQENQNQFIACAWITNKERRMFCLFPHVIKVDITIGMSKEARPLQNIW